MRKSKPVRAALRGAFCRPILASRNLFRMTHDLRTIEVLTDALKRISHAMTAQSDAALAAVQACKSAVDVAVGVIGELKAAHATDAQTIADLQAQLATAQANAEDAGAMATIAETANASTEALNAAVSG